MALPARSFACSFTSLLDPVLELIEGELHDRPSSAPRRGPSGSRRRRRCSRRSPTGRARPRRPPASRRRRSGWIPAGRAAARGRSPVSTTPSPSTSWSASRCSRSRNWSFFPVTFAVFTISDVSTRSTRVSRRISGSIAVNAPGDHELRADHHPHRRRGRRVHVRRLLELELLLQVLQPLPLHELDLLDDREVRDHHRGQRAAQMVVARVSRVVVEAEHGHGLLHLSGWCPPEEGERGESEQRDEAPDVHRFSSTQRDTASRSIGRVTAPSFSTVSWKPRMSKRSPSASSASCRSRWISRLPVMYAVAWPGTAM